MSGSTHKDTILMLGRQLKVDVTQLTLVCQKEENEYNDFLAANKGAKVSDILTQIKPFETRLAECYDTKVLPELNKLYEQNLSAERD